MSSNQAILEVNLQLYSGCQTAKMWLAHTRKAHGKPIHLVLAFMPPADITLDDAVTSPARRERVREPRNPSFQTLRQV